MTDRSVGATVAALERSFDVAAADGIHERDATIAGRRVRFRHANPELAEAFRPAFAHAFQPNRCPDVAPSLTVDVWDSSSGAPTPLPIPPAVGDEAWYERIGDLQVLMHPGRRHLSVFDSRARQAWWWIDDAGELPWYERAAPMRHLVNWWAAKEGLALVHAAAVGRDTVCALLVGRGGAGKSTLALASLASGMRFCGDDMVLLDAGDPWTVHTVWATARLVAGGEGLVPHVEAVRLVDDDDPDVKLVADIWTQFPDCVAASLPVGVVVMPVIGVPSPPERARTAKAALELAASTFLYMPGGDPAATLSSIARMLEQVPVVRLGVGADVSAGVAEIERLLQQRPTGS